MISACVRRASTGRGRGLDQPRPGVARERIGALAAIRQNALGHVTNPWRIGSGGLMAIWPNPDEKAETAGNGRAGAAQHSDCVRVRASEKRELEAAARR